MSNPLIDPAIRRAARAFRRKRLTPIDFDFVLLADCLDAVIASGKLAVGAQLPGERALADEFGVALDTLRNAIRVLQDRGRVVTLPSKGRFVTNR